MRRFLASMFVLVGVLPGCIVFEPHGWDARTENGRFPEPDPRYQHVQDMRPGHQNDLHWTILLAGQCR